MTFLDRINGCSVPVELLQAVLTAFATMPIADRDFEGRTFTVIRILDEPKFAYLAAVHSNLVVSVEFRLSALAHLSTSGAYKAWSLKTATPGMDMIHPDLLEAAAVEPLIEIDGMREGGFDEESFFERVLSITEAKGHA